MMQRLARIGGPRLAVGVLFLTSLALWLVAVVMDARYVSTWLDDTPECIIEQTCTREQVDASHGRASALVTLAVVVLLVALVMEAATAPAREWRRPTTAPWVAIGVACLILPGVGFSVAAYAWLVWSGHSAFGIMVVTCLAISAVVLALLRPARNHVPARLAVWTIPLVGPALAALLVSAEAPEGWLLTVPLVQIGLCCCAALAAHALGRQLSDVKVP